MAGRGRVEVGVPTDEPRGQPRDLHPTSDIRFAITEIAKYGERVDNLATRISDLKSDLSDKIGDLKTDVSGADDRLDSIEKQISFVRGAMWVFGVLFTIALVVIAVLEWRTWNQWVVVGLAALFVVRVALISEVWAQADAIYREYVAEPFPVRTLTQSNLPGFDIEVDAILARRG